MTGVLETRSCPETCDTHNGKLLAKLRDLPAFGKSCTVEGSEHVIASHVQLL